jgi:DNA-binding beta-propeller fold protein YncE
MMIKAPTGDISLATEFNLYNTAPPPYFLNSHDIRFSPDGTKYFVTCQSQFNISPEVRVFQSSNDSLLAAIPVGPMPSEISVSSSTPYLFVTCMEDTIHFAGKRGSVAMINYDDYSVSFIYTGHQPHGIEVDEDKKLVYVINRNASSDGPAPHHTGECAGRNGNVSFIDLNTRTMVMAKNGTSIKKVEIAVDPYSVAVKH